MSDNLTERDQFNFDLIGQLPSGIKDELHAGTSFKGFENSGKALFKTYDTADPQKTLE